MHLVEFLLAQLLRLMVHFASNLSILEGEGIYLAEENRKSFHITTLVSMWLHLHVSVAKVSLLKDLVLVLHFNHGEQRVSVDFIRKAYFTNLRDPRTHHGVRNHSLDRLLITFVLFVFHRIRSIYQMPTTIFISWPEIVIVFRYSTV